MSITTFNNIMNFKNNYPTAQIDSKFHYFVNFDYIRKLIDSIS